MAKYQLGNQDAFVEGCFYPKNSIITTEDDTLPSYRWTPLDDAARAAMLRLPKLDAAKKLAFERLSREPAPESAPVEVKPPSKKSFKSKLFGEPDTLSEAQEQDGKKHRASDKSVL